MSHAYGSVQLNNDHKDLLISQLQAEIYELKRREQEITSLNTQVATLENKCSLVRAERDAIQEDYLRQYEEELKNIRELETEVKNLRASKDHRELHDEMMLFRSRAEQATSELLRLRSEVNSLNDEHLTLKREKAQLEDGIAAMKRQEQHSRGEINRQIDLASVRDKENNDALSRVQASELNRTKIAERATDLQSSLRECTDAIQREQERTNRLRNEAEEEGRTLIQYREEEQELLRGKQVEQERAKNLRDQLSETEDQLRRKEDKIEELRKSISTMKQVDHSVRQQVSGLEMERDALERHAQVIDEQNTELTKELEALAYSEKVVQQTMNRRDRVLEMKSRNEDTLMRSQSEIKLASPNRN